MSDIFEIPELGELEIVEIYDHFNFPILFSCRSVVDQLYMAFYADRLQESNMWLYAEVSRKRFNLIRKGEINLHDTFSNPETGRLLKVIIPDDASKNSVSEYVAPDQINDNVFLSPTEFLDLGNTPFPGQSDLIDLAKSLDREIIGIKLNSVEEYNSEAPVSILGKTFTRLQNIINTIRMVKSGSRKIHAEIKNSMELSLLAIQSGSFDIKLAFKKQYEIQQYLDFSTVQDDIISNSHSIQEDTVSDFLSLIESRNNESDLRNILKRLQLRVTEEYRRFLISLNESGADTTFSWATPRLDKEQTVFLPNHEISELIETLKVLQEEQEESHLVTGKLIGLSLRRKSFEIKGDDDEPYRGHIQKDPDSSIENATISRRYRAELKEILNRSEITDEVVKVEYLLLKLES